MGKGKETLKRCLITCEVMKSPILRKRTLDVSQSGNSCANRVGRRRRPGLSSGRGRCEDRQYDQHFFVDGRVEKLRGDLIDVFTSDVTTFIRRHLRWAQLEAQEQSTGGEGRIAGRLLGGSPIERRRWFREVYGRLPLFVRPALYFVYRYIIRLGFLDGAEGLVFHLLQAFWYRFLVDAIMYERRLMDRNS